MAGNHDPEKLRLEFERLQAEIERRRLMLSERRATLDPLVEAAEHSRELANQYAKITLQSLFLLNGGALIAFPAFGQLVGTAFNQQLGLVGASLAGFVAGLVFAILAALMAFLALDADAQSTYYLLQATEREYLHVQYPDQHDDNSETARVDAKQTSETYRGHFVRRKISAIILGLISLTTFVFGALCAAGVLVRGGSIY